MILFLDIDGVVLPDCAWFLPNQTYDMMRTTFDPACVALLNLTARTLNAKIVLHSSWRSTGFHGLNDLRSHLVAQGIHQDVIADDYLCPIVGNRWDDICAYIDAHPEVTQYRILEDTQPPVGIEDRLAFDWIITTDVYNGYDISDYRRVTGDRRPSEVILLEALITQGDAKHAG